VKVIHSHRTEGTINTWTEKLNPNHPVRIQWTRLAEQQHTSVNSTGQEPG